MAGFILYSIPQVVELIEPSNPAGGVMITSFHNTRSNFKVFWNVDNDIDFFVRDYDRKIKSIGQETYSIIVTNPRSGEIVLQSPLVVMDAALGHLRLTVSAMTAITLPIGTLKYSVVKMMASKKTLLFSDVDYGPQSTLEVKYGPVPAEIPPTSIIPSNFTLIDGAMRAGAYRGPSQLADGSGMRTFLIRGDVFTGQMVFEASLTDTPPSSASDWFIAHTEDFDHFTGTRVVNLEGNYSWVRLVMVKINGELVDILMK